MQKLERDRGYRRNCLALMVLLLLAAAPQSQGQTSQQPSPQPSHLASAYFNRGNERFKTGDFNGAIADYDAAIIFKPKWAQAYNMRGTARYKKGDLDGSIADYTKAIEIDARLALAHYNRGKARRDKGRSGRQPGGLQQGHRNQSALEFCL